MLLGRSRGDVQPTDPDVPAPPSATLRQRVVKASSWTLAGYAASQALRFGGNLLLTRLLFPEAFGIMAIVQAVLQGISMVTDLGVSQSIVLQAKGRESSFTNTAWTVQIIKGAILALGMCAFAVPVAHVYDNPLLAQLMPAMGLVAFIGGFQSTNVAIADRNVDAVRVTIIDVSSLALGLLCMVLLAVQDPTPWALLWGNVATVLVKVVATHLFLPGPPNRLAWDREAARQIASFGGWVMLSSGVTYLTGEGSRLVAGTLLDLRTLGLFGLASTLSLVVWQSIQQLSARVLFPAYSTVMRTEPERFASVVARSRRLQIAAGWLASATLAMVGPFVVHLLYDNRYTAAGPLLQIQSMGLLVGVLSGSYGGVLWAMGRIGLSTLLLAVQALIQWAAMFIGHIWGGPLGVVIGWSFSGWVFYPVAAVVYSRLGLWFPRLDLPVIVASALLSAITFAFSTIAI